jgi:hypothetical protein
VSVKIRKLWRFISTQRNYDNLHGILILLRSYSSRVSVTFRFRITKPLTHLHRDAVQNIGFGFTNTRTANYTPGDTFKPLEPLLKQHRDVGIALSAYTAYCFRFRELPLFGRLQGGREDETRRRVPPELEALGERNSMIATILSRIEFP